MPKTPKSPKKFNESAGNLLNSSSSQYMIDPISSSSRHASTNLTKCLNHVIITPRNSTSTVNNSRRESNNTIETQTSRRSSQMNKSKQSNNNNNKSFEDLEDDLDMNDYDEDDDIFDFKESSNDNLNNKQYHNSLSAASCIENEINTYNITPDTSSSSASSSSFSGNKMPTSPKSRHFKNPLPSTPELPRGPRVVFNRQFKLSSQHSPLPPMLPTTTKSFFVSNLVGM